jgi:hypothetical protein
VLPLTKILYDAITCDAGLIIEWKIGFAFQREIYDASACIQSARGGVAGPEFAAERKFVRWQRASIIRTKLGHTFPI